MSGEDQPSTSVLPPRRLGLGIVGLLAGILVGILGAYVQAMRYLWESPWGVVVIPWGALLVLVVLVLTVRGATWLAMTRWSGWAAFIGWLAFTVLLSSESPGGSVALSGGGRQLFYLIGGVIVAVATATIPVPLRGSAPRTTPVG
jgi:hypothetical protein